MKKSVRTAMIVIAACIMYQCGYLVYCHYKTEPIRKSAIAYIRGAVKNEAITKEEGRTMRRFMQHSVETLLSRRIIADEVKPGAEDVKSRQRQYDEQAQREYKVLAPAMTCYRTVKVEE